MRLYILKEIVNTISYLESLNPDSFEELEEIVSIYNQGEDYCDFTLGSDVGNITIEGCFCRNTDNEIVLSPSFSVLDGETGNLIMEIE